MLPWAHPCLRLSSCCVSGFPGAKKPERNLARKKPKKANGPGIKEQPLRNVPSRRGALERNGWAIYFCGLIQLEPGQLNNECWLNRGRKTTEAPVARTCYGAIFSKSCEVPITLNTRGSCHFCSGILSGREGLIASTLQQFKASA